MYSEKLSLINTKKNINKLFNNTIRQYLPLRNYININNILCIDINKLCIQEITDHLIVNVYHFVKTIGLTYIDTYELSNLIDKILELMDKYNKIFYSEDQENIYTNKCLYKLLRKVAKYTRNYDYESLGNAIYESYIDSIATLFNNNFNEKSKAIINYKLKCYIILFNDLIRYCIKNNIYDEITKDIDLDNFNYVIDNNIIQDNNDSLIKEINDKNKQLNDINTILIEEARKETIKDNLLTNEQDKENKPKSFNPNNIYELFNERTLQEAAEQAKIEDINILSHKDDYTNIIEYKELKHISFNNYYKIHYNLYKLIKVCAKELKIIKDEYNRKNIFEICFYQINENINKIIYQCEYYIKQITLLIYNLDNEHIRSIYYIYDKLYFKHINKIFTDILINTCIIDIYVFHNSERYCRDYQSIKIINVINIIKYLCLNDSEELIKYIRSFSDIAANAFYYIISHYYKDFNFKLYVKYQHPTLYNKFEQNN